MTPARGTTTAKNTSKTRAKATADVSSAKTAAATKTPQKVPAKVAAGSSTVKQTRPLGHVTFVGVGPGDPALLTIAGRDVLANADAVVVEGPEHDPFLAYCRPGVEVVDGSGAEGSRALRIAARARLVVKTAKASANVVRLLTGDPFTFSSGAEEAAACRKAGISFNVVPGVSEVSAVPAYAGIPLTVKGEREVTVLDLAESKLDFSRLHPKQTLVLLNAVDVLKDTTVALVDAGFDAGTPVAATVGGTTTAQTSVVGTLGTIVADLRAAKVTGPAVIVVGSVVEQRETLSWFETKPLFGWRILVPRTKDQAGPLMDRLRRYGAMPEEVPTISVEPPRNPQQMDKAIRGLVEGRYEWVAFTSVNAVKAVREKFDEYGLDARAFSGLKIAAVGEKTAEAIGAWGIRPDLLPSGEQSAAGLVEDWPPFDEVLDPINRVFLPRADIATETLVAGLTDLGWEVDDVTAYRTVRAAPPPAPTREAIKSGKFDAVVFTSSSTVRNLVGIAGKPHASTVIAVIGPATLKTAEEHGLRVDAMAESPSAEELADALARFGADRRDTMVEAGEPVTRPSERRSGSRRKS
ncbi:Uroporphyrin-III C/tetrapyrrole (Corrin/Porphyrin) methyltransferase [Kribbella flavida DSM 17836]|uniref:Uroporphyrin-III C/tetrapyrrole (Corrin/Porphyrin) methyltransferase n=1 Tax=Kribbella flavida (strain DSM 17836 / JCM 10339 / NBRC 14399) TaxID=479435 RepID=D2PWZ4_KRIFD|nr:uroporphyrinogen-III synthase [Kribbella flavida]ADB35374.1 Uroporphyrin-III C/tetrapyrrole (Corrin/Porphyrin) methyltransferase [Kribbella flavida DSM 17836]